MAGTIRNKSGPLEMKSEGTFRKNKWKPCNVKVSSSTYLLYFKDSDNWTKPDGTVFLNSVVKVEPHSSKENNFSFEIHFKNINKTAPSSPWIFNAYSNEDRINWMETIKPGSAQFLKQVASPRSTLASTPMYQNMPDGAATMPAKPKALPRRQDATIPPSLPIKPRTNSLEEYQSPTPTGLPQDYVEPTSFPDPAMSLPIGMSRLNGTPPPVAKRPDHSITNSAKLLERKISSKNSLRLIQDNEYEVMDPSGVEEPPSPSLVKPKPKPRRRTPKPIARSRPGPTDVSDMLDSDEDATYLELIGTAKSTSSKDPPKRSDSQKTVSPNIAEELMKSFNKDQLGALIDMLQQVNGQCDDPYAEGVDTSLRGSFKRMLSTAPEVSSEKMLVIENDGDADDEEYEPRPDWAKAVQQRVVRDNDEGLSETLLSLQADALTLIREDLDDLEQIGEGQFGKVFKGTLSRGMEKTEVAVKTAKINSADKEHAAFIKEMTVMSQLMHPNIVRLFGLIQKDVPAPWIVLEFLHNGDLKSFLSKNKRSSQNLVKYMVDVSMGMHYLSERGLVHRDLAARNILVSENETCKVADFGLLRELPQDESFYHMQTNVPCPVRWMPPEAISDRNFSTASDVWSFGILIWEMFNPTVTPYTKLGNIEVATKVMKGYRLPTPRVCPPVIARIMKACWQDNPKKRPSFLLISTLLTTRVSFPDVPSD